MLGNMHGSIITINAYVCFFHKINQLRLTVLSHGIVHVFRLMHIKKKDDDSFLKFLFEGMFIFLKIKLCIILKSMC